MPEKINSEVLLTFLFIYFFIFFRTYTVLAPTTVRPNTLFKIAATAIRMEYETLTITAVVKRTSYDGKTTESICNG